MLVSNLCCVTRKFLIYIQIYNCIIFLGCVLTIVHLISVKEDDNTLTVIIVSVLGGVIGLIIIVMVIKAVVVHFLRKGNEKK